ncbi:hypothetical protein CHS0354_009622, partial [Potamilus streckersoni]
MQCTAIEAEILFVEIISDLTIACKIVPRTDISEVSRLVLLELGLVSIAVILVIVGYLLFVMLRRMGKSRTDGSLTLHQQYARHVNNEACEEFLGFKNHNRAPIPIPQMQDVVCRSYMEQNYLDIHRKSKSMQNISCHAQYFSNQVRKSLSLQGLIQLPQMIWRQADGDESVDNIRSSKKKDLSNMEGTAKFCKDKKDKNCKLSFDSKLTSLSNNPHTPFEVNLPEDLYSRIDE